MGSHRKLATALRWCAIGLVVLVLVVGLWNQAQRLINGQTTGAVSYFLVILLVFGDAIFPVLPGETTLNAASVLASTGRLNIWLVMLCGCIGAITGDSTVYWLARRSTGRPREWLDKAADFDKTSKAVELIGARGPMFLLFGRYIPGVRFALNVAMGGVVRMPYRTFLFWSSISGTIWSIYTCASAYFISVALDGYPLLSLVVTCVVSSLLIVILVWGQSRLSHRRPDSKVTPQG